MNIRFLVGVFAVCMVLSVVSVYAGTDTPETVMQGAKAGLQEKAAYVSTATDANNFMNRIATDKNYATALKEAIAKKDNNAILALVKQVAPRSSATILKVNPDFTLEIGFAIPFTNHSVVACVSSDGLCHCSSGLCHGSVTVK